ncbi:MAG: protease pro-enzyme activation domain-containing protein [Terracidiphilus sp.]
MKVRTSSASLSASILSPVASRQLFRAVLLATIALSIAPLAWTQTANAITQTVDAAKVRALPNHLPQWASPANSTGVVPADTMLAPMTVVLSRSGQQEQVFEKFLADQQNPASPEYHHWLTPEEMGERFGLSEQDIDTVSGWLQSQGLHVNWVSPSRMFIGFGGTAGDVGRAFHTELQYYKVNGVQRISVSSDPMIPEALVPAIKGIRGLFTIEDKPLHHAASMRSDSPEMDAGGGTHFIAPADFATIYDLPTNLTGAGEIIGIVGRARTNPADFNNFKSLTGSTFTNPTEIVPTAYGGVDPGPAATTCTTSPCSAPGDQSEATLDVLRSGSVAPGATLWLVVASSASGGIDDDTQYLVNANPLPQVITISFGACESAAGAANVNYWDTLFKQAAGEGISVFVASGDAGASGCDSYNAAPPASPLANSPNYICSSSYATCLGGTEFADTSSPSTYWNSSNGTGLSSALSYIPEGGWNEPLNSSSVTQAASSGGGVSTVIATPSWQTGTGVPSARSGRYTPDIAFSSAGHDGYFACLAAGGGSCVVSNGSYGFEYFSGTSAAAPDMAGITALLDQKLGAGQGNLNPQLYPLAASVPTAFHDVTVASSGVSGCTVSTPSMCNNSIPSPTALTGGQAGYLVTTGFDEVTGLGSLDVTQFIDNYGAAAQAPVATTGTATAITGTTATLGGTVNPEGADTHVWFLYGTSSTLSGATQTASVDLGSGTTATAASASLTGLTAGTQYYFQVVAQNATGTTNGAIANFTTTTVALAPVATTGTATAITTTTATLAGTVNPEGADTKIWFLYGTSSTLSGATQTASQDIGSGTTATAVSASLTGLSAGTEYYFQVVAQNATGTTNGAIANFTTTAVSTGSFTITGTAVTVAPGATTGNTSIITVTPSGGFTGPVTLTAAVTSSPANAIEPPTFSFGSTSPVNLTGSSNGTGTLTITTIAPQTSSCTADNRTQHGVPWYAGGGAVLACMLLFGIPARRRNWRRMLGMIALLIALAGGMMACGGGGQKTCSTPVIAGTTPGSYTVTVTGTDGTTTATGTVALTVQ